MDRREFLATTAAAALVPKIVPASEAGQNGYHVIDGCEASIPAAAEVNQRSYHIIGDGEMYIHAEDVIDCGFTIACDGTIAETPTGTPPRDCRLVKSKMLTIRQAE